MRERALSETIPFLRMRLMRLCATAMAADKAAVNACRFCLLSDTAAVLLGFGLFLLIILPIALGTRQDYRRMEGSGGLVGGA